MPVNMLQKQKGYKLKLYVVVLVSAVLALLSLGVSSSQNVQAQTAAGLQSQINQLQQEIEANEKVLDDLGHQAKDLEARITQFEAEINSTQNKIDVTNLKIEKLTLEIAAAEKELARQEAILAESLRQIYKRGDITTIEMLASSESYSDYINEQEYLTRLKSAIQDSTDQINQLKDELESDHEQQSTLKAELEGQRTVLANQRATQAKLLEQTRGEERRYQSVLADLKDQQAEAERALQAYIQAGNFVSLGPIGAGDTVGSVGSTGFSTGPHLHLEIRNSNGSPVNPWQFLNNGWNWPVPGYGAIHQDFGVPNSWYISGYHTGIDTGSAGMRVVAVNSGTIIHRGCSQDSPFFGYTPAYGYSVVIDHGGYFSVYGHMLPPSGAYSHCSGSYGF